MAAAAVAATMVSCSYGERKKIGKENDTWRGFGLTILLD
ncbi:unnamed protein product [Musa textilis]